ncbi:MAG: hypothetical protein BWX88_01583 [Planctomycetes bacterium ADurb.Bin126]|nr:MAG: hypothetical protein BWX88_01583 [Planctomycetes bacterium ADurb.Bin126]HOD83310.1 TPM domain-containing protein [Phycisphaerae bacterium]HQL74446.1 TPM domain-containing protein [Phycisphaerae bacterium]
MYSILSKAMRTAPVCAAAVGLLVLITCCGPAWAQEREGPEFDPARLEADRPPPRTQPPRTATDTLDRPLIQPSTHRAGYIDLQPPGQREFILDQADLLSPEEEKKIREVASSLLKDKATPVIVVTIESMAAHNGAGMRIETFARLLFDQWQIGHEKLGETNWNTGILLLVSRRDRKARIELGAGWKRDKDDAARKIMDDLIIPRFKDGDYAAGIVAGVEGLDKMARDLELPKKPVSPLRILLIVAAVGLGIFTVVSLARRGSGGWAWVFWGVALGIVGMILYSVLSNAGRRGGGGGGGGFSGGSFGGGFSGGGGATGSW